LIICKERRGPPNHARSLTLYNANNHRLCDFNTVRSRNFTQQNEKRWVGIYGWVAYKIVRVLVQIIQGWSHSLAEYCADERLVVDVTIGSDLDTLEQLIDLLVRHLLTELGEDIS